MAGDYRGAVEDLERALELGGVVVEEVMPDLEEARRRLAEY